MIGGWRQTEKWIDGDRWRDGGIDGDGYKDIELGIQMLEILQIH